jgi:hypothetical protein
MPINHKRNMRYLNASITRTRAAARPLLLECAMFLAVCCFLLFTLMLWYTMNPMNELINLIFTEGLSHPFEQQQLPTTLSHRVEEQAGYVAL